MGDLCERWRAADLKETLVCEEMNGKYLKLLMEFIQTHEKMPKVKFVMKKTLSKNELNR